MNPAATPPWSRGAASVDARLDPRQRPCDTSDFHLVSRPAIRKGEATIKKALPSQGRWAFRGSTLVLLPNASEGLMAAVIAGGTGPSTRPRRGRLASATKVWGLSGSGSEGVFVRAVGGGVPAKLPFSGRHRRGYSSSSTPVFDCPEYSSGASHAESRPKGQGGDARTSVTDRRPQERSRPPGRIPRSFGCLA